MFDRLFEKQLDAEIQKTVEAILAIAAGDVIAHAKLTGVLQGLRRSRDILHTLRRRDNLGDED